MIELENGEVTSAPLSIIAKDDPITCTIYARDDNLLDRDGWQCFKSIAQHELKFCQPGQAPVILSRSMLQVWV
jgi:hypothetical protein